MNAALFDLKASFFQLELEDGRPFIFEIAGQKYQFDRLNRYSASAEIMQLICQCLAEQATKGTEARFRVHVDNIIFMGTYVVSDLRSCCYSNQAQATS